MAANTERKLNTAIARLLYVLAELTLTQTQKQIAKQLNFSETQLSRAKKADKVSIRMGRAIEREYGYREDWILDGTGPERGQEASPLFQTPARLPVASAGVKGTGDPSAVFEDPRIPIPILSYECGSCRGPIKHPARLCPHCRSEPLWPEAKKE